MKVTSTLFLFIYLSCSMVSAEQEILLWTNGAPDFESRRNEPTKAKGWMNDNGLLKSIK